MSDILETLVDELKLLLTIGFTDIIDILIIAFLVYKILGLIIKTNSLRVAKGVVVVLFALWISELLGLHMINFLLSTALELGVIALVILFQPELRRLLEKLGSSKLHNFLGIHEKEGGMHSSRVLMKYRLSCSREASRMVGMPCFFAISVAAFMFS